MKKATFYSGRYCGPCIDMKAIVKADPDLRKAVKIVEFDLAEVEKAWEPPNVYAVGATHVTASVAPMGLA